MGRGEQLEEIQLDLSAYSLALVYPGIHVSTGEAFSMMMPTRNRKPIQDIVRLPVEEWKQLLVNDFEKPVFEKYPSIKQLKEELYAQGAVYASLTGSGSAVYGLFPKTEKPLFSFPASYRSSFFELSPSIR
jgi:4-diphosphocytidyl-2-C-methyl-D-erythritol kinase